MNDNSFESAKRLIGLLRDKRLHVSAAESCTGGLLASILTSVSGASEVLDGTAVTYARSVKENLIGVPAAVIDGEGIVSTACAEAMAEGAAKLFNADLAAGVTGWAGPYDGDDGQPAGTVCIGIFAKGLDPVSVCYRFAGDRNTVRRSAAERAIKLLIDAADRLPAKKSDTNIV